MAPKISLAATSTNDAAILADWLAHVRDLADEICLVDTGSTDETLEVARRCDVQVSLFLWCDDRADLRNEALRICSGEWVLVLDPGEWIEPEDLERVRALTDGPRGQVYEFSTLHYTHDEPRDDSAPAPSDDAYMPDFASAYRTEKVRLFRRQDGWCFEGMGAEEHLGPASRLSGHIAHSDVTIRHFPSTATLHAPVIPHQPLAGDKSSGDIAQARTLLENGSLEQARRIASSLVEQEPHDAAALAVLGMAERALRHFEDAEAHLSLATQLDDDLTEAWRELGQLRLERNDAASAVSALSRALKQDENWADGYRYLAMALEGVDQHDNAARAAKTALKQQPDSPDNLRVFIHLMLRLERRAQARTFLNRLLEHGASNPDIVNALGELYYYDELYAESKEYFERAAQAGIYSAFNNLGVVYFIEGQYDEARRAFEQCLAGEPEHPGARKNLKQVLEHLNRGHE